MLLLLILYSQWGETDNLEAKFYQHVPYVHSERAESLHEFNVLHYELNVTLPMTSRSISGTNLITCCSRVDNLTSAVIHAHTLTIDSILVDGTATTHTANGDSLIISLPYTYNTNDTFDIHIGYHGSWSVTYYQSGFVYYPRNYDYNTLHALAYTLGEPWDARAWMPCYDDPFDKADQGCVMHVTVPDSYTVCANGALNGVDYAQDRATFTWTEHYPIATYLMHFGASIFTPWSNWFYSPSGDTVEIKHFVWPEDSAQSVSSLGDVLVSIALLDSMYGPYPFDRYGHDIVYPYAWGGMEHQENTTLHRSAVGGSHSWKRVICHELSHQWWGDMVTCVDFRDIWLNEGCATSSDANYDWHTLGWSSYIATLLGRAQDYFVEDASYRRPLYDPPLDSIFSWGFTYCKACWVMHMLRFLDQDHFFEGMRAYRDSFEYGCACTDDMNTVFSLVYGTDLTWFFDEWVYDQGYPEYEVYWNCIPSGNDFLFRVNVYQVQTNAPAVFHMPVQILLNTTGTDTTVTIPITASPQYAEFVIGDSVTSINFDPNYRVLCKYETFYGIEEVVQGDPLYNDLVIGMVPSTHPKVTYVVNQTGHIRLVLYDVTGRVEHTLFDGVRIPGVYTVAVHDLPAGIYFCRLVTPVNEKVAKLVVVR
jgi:aminopeptidase N